jgi:hypothetical protein
MEHPMNAWATMMILAGGLFAGGVTTLAWSRIPAWREMPPQRFVTDFAHTIRRADKIQPALLVTAIVSAAAFAPTAGSTAAVLALFGAGGFLATLIGSAVALVPLQRRILTASPHQPGLEGMRMRWLRGHLGRSALSVACFIVVAVAAAI